MPRVGSKRKKTKTHVVQTDEDLTSVPKSMVIKRTTLSKDLKDLKRELREVFYPFTAMKFKESNKMKLKEIMDGTKAFDVSNLFMLSSNEKGDYLKFVKLTNGPTHTFKINNYSLGNDIRK